MAYPYDDPEEALIAEAIKNNRNLRNASVFGAGFAPGSGLLDAFGGMPAMDQGMSPSMLHNMQQGNYLDTFFQGLGAGGDLAMMTGALAPFGVAMKAAAAAGKAGKAGKAASKIAKAPMEDALQLAQKRAALPVSEGGFGLPTGNTAMDRARAMSAVDVYHGTASDVKEIDTSKFGSSTGAQSAKKAFWVTDDPSITARSYAEYAAKDAPILRLNRMADEAADKGDWETYDNIVVQMENLEKQIYNQPLRGQNIMPMSLLGGNVKRMDAKGLEFSDVEGGVNTFLNKALSQGADAAQISNLSDAAGRVNVPATHYGVFNPDNLRSRFAAFDPFRRNAAIAAAMGVAAPNLMAQDRDEEEKNLMRMIGR